MGRELAGRDRVAILELDESIAVIRIDLFLEVEVSEVCDPVLDVLLNPVEDRLGDRGVMCDVGARGGRSSGTRTTSVGKSSDKCVRPTRLAW